MSERWVKSNHTFKVSLSFRVNEKLTDAHENFLREAVEMLILNNGLVSEVQEAFDNRFPDDDLQIAGGFGRTGQWEKE